MDQLKLPVSELTDFHPYDTGLDQYPLALAREYEDRVPERKPCERDQFLALLAGIAALRKTPGILSPSEIGFTTLPLCATLQQKAECRAHLEKVFGITDQRSMLEFCNRELRCHTQYLDFEGFWEGRPPFSLTQLNEKAQAFFQTARDFSAQFYPIVGHQGYLAWDISECVGHLRAGYACGLLDSQAFNELADYWVVQAQIFKNWPEFAVSLICGELYWDFRHGSKLPELNKGLDLWNKLVHILLDNEDAWGSGMWYTPPRKKEFLLWAPEFRNYLPQWEGPNGCFATDHITVLGKRVGWCYREQPDSDEFPDSGWRFFSGEETDEYVNDLAHTDVCNLNDVCNFDPDVLPLLSAPFGTAYARGEDGIFRAEPFTPPEH